MYLIFRIIKELETTTTTTTTTENPTTTTTESTTTENPTTTEKETSTLTTTIKYTTSTTATTNMPTTTTDVPTTYQVPEDFNGNPLISRAVSTPNEGTLIILRPDIKFQNTGKILKVSYYLSQYSPDTEEMYIFILESDYIPRSNENSYKAVKEQRCIANKVGVNECSLTHFNYEINDVIGVGFVEKSGLTYDIETCVNGGYDRPKIFESLTSPSGVLYTETQFTLLSECRTYSIQFEFQYD
ncbi:DgyrCDS13411 [Dimorphilus gyrociliatus]|uniref:DgyrCDS13411 n=1 Tax=Dimorphilus gyrociliatus TaxID=2664684 RepID=A0A7I8WAK6_9ANNE|nr:DgyrCDS13411 [Dimorphilus gyrociliatus]